MPTDHWTKTPVILMKANEIVDALLDGRGDVRRERSFRMCATYCRHRAVSQDEFDSLPMAWHAAPPVDIAGGPVEILSETEAMPKLPSTRPCEHPAEWIPLWKLMGQQSGDDRLKIPKDCEACPPCLARLRS